MESRRTLEVEHVPVPPGGRSGDREDLPRYDSDSEADLTTSPIQDSSLERRIPVEYYLSSNHTAPHRYEKITFDPTLTIAELRQELSHRSNWARFELSGRNVNDDTHFNLDDNERVCDVLIEDDVVMVHRIDTSGYNQNATYDQPQMQPDYQSSYQSVVPHTPPQALHRLSRNDPFEQSQVPPSFAPPADNNPPLQRYPQSYLSPVPHTPPSRHLSLSSTNSDHPPPSFSDPNTRPVQEENHYDPYQRGPPTPTHTYSNALPAYQQQYPQTPPTLPTSSMKIRFYSPTDPFYGFSNFSSHPVEYDGKVYPTAEHLYQCLKFMPYRPGIAEHIRTNAKTVVDANRESRRFEPEMRSDWYQVNLRMMEEILYSKFTQHQDLWNDLFQTGEAIIINCSPDSFWGRGLDGQGRNELGRALMRLRERLRTTSQPQDEYYSSDDESPVIQNRPVEMY